MKPQEGLQQNSFSGCGGVRHKTEPEEGILPVEALCQDDDDRYVYKNGKREKNKQLKGIISKTSFFF